jgi:sulfite reductase alpha subunit-like flavoprotein
MRSILLEREAALESLQQQYQVQLEKSGSAIVPQHNRTGENILVFGCRKESADFYYQSDWKRMEAANSLKLWPAFSQAQGEKVYVQQVLRSIHEQNQFCLVDHIVKRLGAIYIAGNPKMARAVKDEIKAILAKEIGDKEATRWIKMLQRLGRYSVEAWS